MQVSNITSPIDLLGKEGIAAGGGVATGTEKPNESFGAFLKQSFNDVNAMLQTSDKKAADMAVGKSESLHDAMISFEKAETAFKLLVQVRNKAIDAYHEIMRMQV